MIKTNKILALILSCLLIISALPLTAGAAEEVIKWKGGYDSGSSGNSGTVYDGYEDMPYTVYLNEGGTGGWNHIGNDWGDAMELAPNNHKLSFELTPSYTGEYKLEVEVSSAGDILHSYVDDIEIGTTEATGGFYGFSGMQDAGTVVLEAGVPVRISFSNRNDSGAGNGIALRDCVLTFVREAEPPKEETIHWQAGWDANNNPDDIHYDIGGQEPSWIGADYGIILDIAQLDRMIKYAITPKYTGYYTLYMTMGTHGLTTIEINVDGQKIDDFSFSTTNWDTREKFEVANIFVVENTEFNLGITLKSGAFGAMDCELVYVSEPQIEASSIENGDVVTRNTDVITLDFSRELNEDKLSDAVVAIEDSLSNELEYTLELDEADASKVNIILSESLKYDESYTFTHMAFTDSVGYTTEEISLDFSTAAEADDQSNDNSTVEMYADVENTTFTIAGTVYGSKGQVIAGREVTVSVTSPLGNDTKVIDTVVSDENGEFALSYTLSQEEEENGGIYTFSAAAEHAPLYEDTVRYLSAGQKLALLGALEGYTTYGEVETFFATDTNAADLGVNMASLSELTDDSLFYDRLAKASYKNDDGDYDVKVFEKVWNTSYALEMINQKNNDAVTLSCLEDADFAAAISLETEKYELLDEQKSAFVSAVTALDRQENAEAFGTEVAKLLNEYLLKENDKTDLALTLSDASVYIGQTAEVALALTAKTADICEYIVEVTCPSGGVAEDISFAKLDGTTVSKTTSGTTASFRVTNVGGELTKLGTLEYSSSSEKDITLNVGGTAVYDIEGTRLTCDIAKSTVDIKVKKNESKGGSGNSSSYSSSGGGNKVVSAPVTDPDEGKQEVTSPSGTGFTDTADAQWAEKSIISLYNKGIISEAADGKFRPNDSVTRAEFVKMLTVALRITDKSAHVTLGDVSQSDWFYTYVSAAVNYGLVLGDEHGNFNPNDQITRQDICVIISRAMDKLGYPMLGDNGNLFIDDYMISDYAKSAVYRMRTHEIVNGTGDGSFAPLADATRAATAKMIDTFMKEAGI